MALLLVGCAKEYDDSELKNRVTTLETKVGNLEAQMQVAQKVALGQFVQKVEQTADGLTITYGDGTVLTVHVSTGSGAGTLSVVKNAAGDLCWAIDGVILQYEGKDLLVGAVSNIYVENGKLYAVINGQAKELGGFSGGSELKDGIFTAIAVTDEAVVLTLSDNSTIKLPLANAFKLVIAKTKYAVTTTDPFDVPYTVQAKTNNTVVDIFTDGNFSATVEADKFVITPKAVVEGSALAYADSQVGLTSIVKLNFGAEGEQDYATISDEPYSEEIDYLGEAANGTVEAHVVSNASIDVKSETSWISVVSVKATTYTVTLKLEDNTTDEIRTGEVKVYAAGTETVLQTIKVAQKASEIKYEHYNPAGWNKVFNMADYNTNSTFIWSQGLSLNPSAVTLQWKFYANKWNNHKFTDKDEKGNTLYANRLGEFANADESKSVLFRFSNDGDVDGQLCLNAGALGLSQVQVGKDGKPYAWPAQEWVVLTIVSDGAKVHVYQDNTLLGSYDATPGASWDLERVDLSMTWDDGSNWPLAQAFNGYTAYIRVWSKALAASEIAATLCEVPAQYQDGLEACWNFEGSTDKWVENSVDKDIDYALDFTSCFDGNGNAKDKGDAAAAAWVTLSGSELPGICYSVE